MKLFFKNKKYSQVTLETVMVFVCLALFGVACVRVFSNLTYNQLKRIEVYKNTRLAAANPTYGANILSQTLPTPSGEGFISDPITFLDYSPSNTLISDATLPKTDFSMILYEDPYLNDYFYWIERFNKYFNVVLPYISNQAYSFAKDLEFKCRRRPHHYYYYYHRHFSCWQPPDYLEKAKYLNAKIREYYIESYNSLSKAISCLEKTIREDKNISESIKKNLRTIEEQLKCSRCNIQCPQQGTLYAECCYELKKKKEECFDETSDCCIYYDKCNAADTPSYCFEYCYPLCKNKEAPCLKMEIFKRVNYVENYLGEYRCYRYYCRPTFRHTEAIKKLKELAKDFFGNPIVEDEEYKGRSLMQGPFVRKDVRRKIFSIREDIEKAGSINNLNKKPYILRAKKQTEELLNEIPSSQNIMTKEFQFYRTLKDLDEVLDIWLRYFEKYKKDKDKKIENVLDISYRLSDLYSEVLKIISTAQK